MPKLLIPVYGHQSAAGPSQETPRITRGDAGRNIFTPLEAQTDYKLTNRCATLVPSFISSLSKVDSII